MALSWSMDKLGPICRTVEDCALVLDAIHGRDGKDRTVQPAAFNWDANLDWRKLRVGYLKTAFERKPEEAQEAAKEEPPATPEEQKKREERKKRREAARARAEYDRKYNDAALAKLREMGVNLVPVEMPKFPYDAMVTMLTAESAAAFDELTRSGKDKLLTSQKDYGRASAQNGDGCRRKGVRRFRRDCGPDKRRTACDHKFNGPSGSHSTERTARKRRAEAAY